MSALLVGYARCSTDQQDLTAQRDALLNLGVETERIYVDHGLTGSSRERPGLREALAACRSGEKRHIVERDGLVLAVDEPQDGTLVAEIDERDQPSQFVPDWLNVVADVSGDEAWTGGRLANVGDTRSAR